MNLEIWKQKAKQKYGELYDYSETKYNGRHKAITIRCIKHNCYFNVFTDRFLRENSCCPKCKKETKIKEKEDNFIKLSKEKFGNKFDYSLIHYINCDTKVKIKCNDCNQVFEVTPYEHLKRKDCPYCLGYYKTTKDFIKQANNKNLDYSLVKYSGAKAPIILKCKICGKTFKSTPNNILNGEGCPYCGMKKFQKAGNLAMIKKNKEIILAKIKEKYNDKYDVSENTNFGVDSKIKIKCNKCGNYFYKIIKYFIQGYECPYCYPTRYLGEQKIMNYLKEKGIKFEVQKTFSDLKNKDYLSFDFYIPSENICIEYNGIQHYHWNKFFQPTYHDFLVQKHHDWLKRKYCRDHNIELIIIPYWKEENFEDFNARTIY